MKRRKIRYEIHAIKLANYSRINYTIVVDNFTIWCRMGGVFFFFCCTSIRRFHRTFHRIKLHNCGLAVQSKFTTHLLWVFPNHPLVVAADFLWLNAIILHRMARRNRGWGEVKKKKKHFRLAHPAGFACRQM